MNKLTEVISKLWKWYKKLSQKPHPITKEIFPKAKEGKDWDRGNIKRIEQAVQSLNLQIAKSIVKSFQDYPNAWEYTSESARHGVYFVVKHGQLQLHISRAGMFVPDKVYDYKAIDARLAINGVLLCNTTFDIETSNFLHTGFYLYIQTFHIAKEAFELECGRRDNAQDLLNKLEFYQPKS